MTGQRQDSARAVRIRELDRLLERDPDSFSARAERAGLLRELGDFEPAKRDYLELIRQKPADFRTLNDFGTLVLKAGYRDAAHSLFNEAVRRHPGNPIGHVNLANLLLATDEPELARVHFETALRLDPDHIHAHRGMAYVLGASGNASGAKRHRDRGFKNQFLTTLPYRGEDPPVRILALVSAAGGNTPTDSFFDDTVFQTTVLVADYFDWKLALPPHDLVFNCVGDADICAEGIEAARMIVLRTDRPVINHPDAVARTGRAANALRMRSVPHVITPRITSVSRQALAGGDAAGIVAAGGFSFPVLVRAPGFHTGYHFIRTENPRMLAEAAATLPGDDVWLIEPLDALDGAGMFRKFRVMIVDGVVYPLHLAISRNWKVHYFTADMADSPDNRAQDGAFLANMPAVVGELGVAALDRIAATLRLDYGGIDFGVNAAGDILLFEANATMVMAPLAPDEKWAYRRPAFDAVFAAIRRMLLDRATAGRRLAAAVR